MFTTVKQCLLAFTLLAASSWAIELQFAPDPAAQESGTVFVLKDTLFDNMLYVSSQLVEHIFNTESRPVPVRQKYIIPDREGREWYLTVDNPYIVIGEEVYNLTYPVRRGPNFIYLPLNPLLKLLQLPDQLSFR